MNISDDAVDAVKKSSGYGLTLDDRIRVGLHAALPHLLADYRERLVKASAEMGHLADERGEMDNHYFRLGGKIQGVDLALSYLDEMLRP